MSDFVPPSGPPPPRVPEGWKAVWNDQYKEWFFVNLYTKQSQWDKPESAAVDPNSSYHAPPGDAPPPSYAQGTHAAVTDSKSPNLQSNNPYSQNVAESDEAFARRLQEEENRRVSAEKARGAANGYYDSSSTQGYPNAPDYSSQQQSQQQQQVPAGASSSSSSGSRGFLSKIKEKMNNPSQQRPMGAPMMGYNAGGYPPQQYGGYPQQQYGGYPQQGGYGRPMGGMPMGMGGGMMGGGYGQPVKRKGGLGAGGAAALGVGGGLVGGMLLMDGMDHMQDNAYDQGYDQGMDQGDMDGGDMGGGDF